MAKTVSVGSIIVNVLANTRGFSLAKPRKELSSFDKAVHGLTRVPAVIGAAFAAVGTALAASAVVSEVRRITDSLGDLNDFAQRIGIASDKLIGLQYGAKFVGVSADQMSSSLQTMTRQIGEAIHGGGKAKDVFRAMGVDLAELARMAPDQAFLRIAQGINSLTSEEEQLRATMRIFGQDGAKLLNFIRQGEDGIRKFVREAKTIGLAITQDDIGKVDALGDALDKLGATWEGAKNAIIIDIAPAAVKAVEALQEATQGVKLLYTRGDSAISSAAKGAFMTTGLGALTGAQGYLSRKYNEWAIANNVAMGSPAIRPEERTYYADGRVISDEYKTARQRWFDATQKWEEQMGLSRGSAYIQTQLQIPDYIKQLSRESFAALERSSTMVDVRPDSNLGWWQLVERKVKDASTSLVDGLTMVGDAIKPFEGVGRESYYDSLLDKLWPRASGDTDERGVAMGDRRNSLLESTSAEGYAALRANLRNDPALAEQKKQVSILTRIEQNTKGFIVSASGL